MENRINLKAYENVERIQSDFDGKELRDYFDTKMLTAQSDLVFLQLLYQNMECRDLNVCEIGCGNAKLLCALDKNEMLKHGVGYEVSEARCKMAKKFIQLSSAKNVEVINSNFLEEKDDNKYDLIIMVDIVFQFIINLYEGAFEETMSWLKEHLAENGKVFMEIEDFTPKIDKILCDGEERCWLEYPEGDPYIYNLIHISYDQGNLIHKKIFIRRDDHSFSENTLVVYQFTKETLKDNLEKHGFFVDFYNYYNSDEEKELELETGEYNENVFRAVCGINNF